MTRELNSLKALGEFCLIPTHGLGTGLRDLDVSPILYRVGRRNGVKSLDFRLTTKRL